MQESQDSPIWNSGMWEVMSAYKLIFFLLFLWTNNMQIVFTLVPPFHCSLFTCCLPFLLHPIQYPFWVLYTPLMHSAQSLSLSSCVLHICAVLAPSCQLDCGYVCFSFFAMQLFTHFCMLIAPLWAHGMDGEGDLVICSVSCWVSLLQWERNTVTLSCHLMSLLESFTSFWIVTISIRY